MPANLPPHYFEVEKKLKSAVDPVEKIQIMEELLAIIPKHKGTEKLLAMYKSKIAKMRDEARKKSGVARHTHVIRHAGAGQIILLGGPNSGRSSLIRALTGAEPLISPTPFSTHDAAPYMMPFGSTQVQLIDTPPITPQFMETWLIDIIKTCDAVLWVLDLSDPLMTESLELLLEQFREKRVEFQSSAPDIHEPGAPFIKKTLLAAHKTDLPDSDFMLELLNEWAAKRWNIIPVSAHDGSGSETLRQHLFHILNVIRVYSKTPGKKAELKDPFTLKKGSSLMDMAKAVHKDFAEKLAFARIWNAHKYDGQRINRDYILEDEDIIELHI